MSHQDIADQQVSLSSATTAFELWETEYRESPADFLAAEETAAMEISTLSEGRAIYFLALLRKVNGA